MRKFFNWPFCPNSPDQSRFVALEMRRGALELSDLLEKELKDCTNSSYF
jgi:hypothetical protein